MVFIRSYIGFRVARVVKGLFSCELLGNIHEVCFLKRASEKLCIWEFDHAGIRIRSKLYVNPTKETLRVETPEASVGVQAPPNPSPSKPVAVASGQELVTQPEAPPKEAQQAPLQPSEPETAPKEATAEAARQPSEAVPPEQQASAPETASKKAAAEAPRQPREAIAPASVQQASSEQAPLQASEPQTVPKEAAPPASAHQAPYQASQQQTALPASVQQAPVQPNEPQTVLTATVPPASVQLPAANQQTCQQTASTVPAATSQPHTGTQQAPLDAKQLPPSTSEVALTSKQQAPAVPTTTPAAAAEQPAPVPNSQQAAMPEKASTQPSTQELLAKIAQLQSMLNAKPAPAAEAIVLATPTNRLREKSSPSTTPSWTSRTLTRSPTEASMASMMEPWSEDDMDVDNVDAKNIVVSPDGTIASSLQRIQAVQCLGFRVYIYIYIYIGLYRV